MTGTILGNLTDAREASVNLNNAYEGCVDSETMVDMEVFDDSTSKIMSGCKTCRNLALIVILFQVILLICSAIYFYVCVYHPYPNDKEYCEKQKIREEAEMAKEEESRQS